MSAQLLSIHLDLLDPHPGNPRLALREDVIETITTHINGHGFDPAHALLVRPLAGRFQIVSGHHRWEAGRRAGLTELACWVRELSDADAYMELVLCNAQAELTELEEGRHALNSGLSQRAYAERVGKKASTLKDRWNAAEVAKHCANIRAADLSDRWLCLSVIHAAPERDWPTLAQRAIDDEWTVEETREHVARARGRAQRENIEKERRVSFETIDARRAHYAKHGVSLTDWPKLSADDRTWLLNPDGIASSSFNAQTSSDIEWAMWSWNPVTGCLHGCPYCYARVIATSERTAAAFPHGFAPALRPARLLQPRSMMLPADAHTDARHRNVFVCSMADLFGRWAPAEWIEAVLREVRAAPEWNFLFLTKFPKRLAEFDIPNNCWMGCTVDLQARIPSAETAFAKVKSKVRWLSIEPLLEPLRFSRLDLFDWVVIGGATAQPATETSPEVPDWHPPLDWIIDLIAQARAAKCRVYLKSNLLGSRILELPDGQPIIGELQEAPNVFHYLGQKTKEQIEVGEVA